MTLIGQLADQAQATPAETAAVLLSRQRAGHIETGATVLHANAQEAAAHDEVLAQLDKASGGKTVWRRAPDEVGRAGI